MSSAATTIFRLKAAERKAALKAQLEHAAQGGEVDPDQILSDATAVNISHVDVARAIDVLTERFERTQGFTSSNWDERIESAKAEAIAAHNALEEAKTAAEAAREACRTASQRYEVAVNRRQHEINARAAAARELEAYMRNTAGPGHDPSDWRNVEF
jgi:hypothetical protein